MCDSMDSEARFDCNQHHKIPALHAYMSVSSLDQNLNPCLGVETVRGQACITTVCSQLWCHRDQITVLVGMLDLGKSTDSLAVPEHTRYKSNN